MAHGILYLLVGIVGLTFVGSEPAIDHSIINENVLFYKDGEMSLSGSRWI